MKILKKLTAPIILLFVVVSALPFVSHAEMNKERLTTTYEIDDLVIMVEWETEEPIVRFISPDGETFDPNVPKDGAQVSRGGNTMFYYIPDAAKGDWYVEYDKLSNESIYMSIIENTGVFVVEDIRAAVNNNRCEVKFSVYYGSERRISYRVYLSATEGVMGEEVMSGGGYTGREISTSFNMSDYGSGDSYRVYVYAYFTDGDIEVYDGAYSAPFSYTNPNQPTTETKGLELDVYPLEYTAELRFEADSYYNYLAAFFVKNVREEGKAAEYGDDADYTETVEGRYGSVSVPFVYNIADELTVRFSEKRYNGVYSTPSVFTVDFAKLPTVVFEDIDATNKQSISADFSGFADGTEVTVINGIGTTSLFISGDKSVDIEVPEYESTVTVRVKYADGINLIYEKEIYRDTTPPSIYMAEDYSDVKTELDSYIIIGTVTDASSFTIGGQPVTLAPNGDFSYEAKLAAGENILEAVASDALGNSSIYTMKITKPDGISDVGKKTDTPTGLGPKSLLSIISSANGVWKYAIGILAAVIAIAIGVVASVTWRKKPNAVMTAHHIFAAFAVISGISAIYHGIRYALYAIYNSNFTFIEAVSKSVFDAYELLSRESQYLKVCLISAAVFGASVAVIAVTMFVVRPIVNKHKAKKNQ